MYIDSHCHLTDEQFAEDLPAVLARARAAKVSGILCPGVTLEDSRTAVEIANAHKVWAAVGVHPHEAKTFTDGTPDELRKLMSDKRVLGIGEIGLDFHYNLSSPEEQMTAFRAQLELARSLKKPAIIHSREAPGETMEVLEAVADGRPLRGIMHCFTGDAAMAERCWKLGLHISFSGILTFKNAEALRLVAGAVPPDRLLIETDAPYLTPVPRRGERNEPCNVTLTAKILADIRGLTVHELSAITIYNFKRLFHPPS